MKGRIKKTIITITVLVLIQFTYVYLVKSEIMNQTNNNNLIIVDKNNYSEYKSIQEAIDNANPGSTIYIKNGEYPEIIYIKKTIQLIGENKDYTLINPISQENKCAIYIGAPNIRIKNLGITNGAPGLYSQGIKISSRNIEIENCKIFNTPVGIAIWTNENMINNSVFYGCKDEGIALLGCSKNPCNKNYISNCLFYDNCDGIELQHSSYNRIENCRFYNNTHIGIDILGSDNNKNIISNCELINNKVKGIYISSLDSNKIIDCYIKENTNDEIKINQYPENNQIVLNEKSEEKTQSMLNISMILQKLLQKFNNLENLKT